MPYTQLADRTPGIDTIQESESKKREPTARLFHPRRASFMREYSYIHLDPISNPYLPLTYSRLRRSGRELAISPYRPRSRVVS
jgi:hypothetical protein